MAKAKTDVAVKPVDENLPAYLQGMTTPIDNKDNFDSTDIVLPQVKLLQGTSDQCKDFESAQQGNFWHTGMDLNLGNELSFIVISRKKKYLLQAPMDDGQGIFARAEDALTWDRLGSWEVQVDKKTKATWEITDLDVAASGLTAWGTYDPEDENSPPAATLFYEYLVLIVGHENLGPAIISLARSSIKRAKKGLNDKIDMHASDGRPVQAIRFGARIKDEVNDSGQDYFNWQFVGDGFSTEEQYNKCKSLAETLKEYKVQDEGKIDGAADADDGEGKF